MTYRAEIWKKHLIGNSNVIHEKRKIYHNVIVKYPYSIDNKLDTQINKDLPRTNLQGSAWLTDDKKNIIELILHQYIQVMPCDGYLQGFAYIISVLYYVYESHDKEHALSDTFWSFVAIVSIIRPSIPDHDPDDFIEYTKTWSNHFKRHLKYNDSRTHTWLKSFYESITPTLTVKWIMIWFTQQFELKELLILWDAIITCENAYRLKLMAIIASNIVIQHSNSIENWSYTCPTEIGPRLMSVKASDAEVIIQNSRDAMLQFKFNI